MKQLKFFFFSTFFLFLFEYCAQGQQPLKIWYRHPAKEWNRAFPVGNGRLAAMVFGKVNDEIIQLNEESIYAGHRIDDNNPQSLSHLKEIQQLIFDGKNNEAHALMNRYMLATPPAFRSYQYLGNVHLHFNGLDSNAKDYTHVLDLADGIVATNYDDAGVRITREVFVSAPDDAIFIHVKANKKRSLNFTLSYDRQKDATVEPLDKTSLLLSGMIMDDSTAEEGPGGPGVKFHSIVRIIHNDGTAKVSGNSIAIGNASDITFAISACTDYNLKKLDFDRSIDSRKLVEDKMDALKNKSYTDIKTRHLSEYRPLMQSVDFSLGKDSFSTFSTDERLARVKKGAVDNGLTALYFQFGRYLLFSSSRFPARLPANLQGKWNNMLKAPWNSDYHTNINLQMNYWPADVANVAGTFDPLVAFVDAYRDPGRNAAKEMYGADGWMVHHSTDIFGRTGIISGIHWGTSPLAGVWLCLNLWDHYLFTKDSIYLQSRLYPIMKEAAQFVQSFLVKDNKGYLVTAPSMSPENSFILPNGKTDQITEAPTIDIMLIQSLYKACIQAASTLNIDEKFTDSLKKTLSQLPPIQLSKRNGGTIQEWLEDYQEVEPGHRHISHLLGLYPAYLITEKDSVLFDAAKKTLARRLANGGGHTGWSRAWIINFYARLLDGEKAFENVQALLQKSTLENLFDIHPPFQIDGNFGATAGIAEMLLQSHAGYIQLLPALPKAWSNGHVKGLKARGAFEIEMTWKNGQLTQARLKSLKGGKAVIHYDGKEKVIETQIGKEYDIL